MDGLICPISLRMSKFAPDTFFNGNIVVKQGKNGYRFSIDAVLLSDFLKPKQFDMIADLGTGSGIIPLILAHRYPETRYIGIEIQKELADLAMQNVRDNALQDRIRIVCQDMKTVDMNMISGPVDIVVCNPPYHRPGSGRINPDSQRAVARHEIKVTLDGVLETANRLLRTAGRFLCIYPAERLTDLVATMRRVGVEPKRLRMIHSRIGEAARLILMEGMKGAQPGIKIAPPLYVYKNRHDYTDEVEKMFMP